MEVISFMNYKGGVGKTTLASNVACELAWKGNKVLLMDMDPQTNLTLSFMEIDDYQNLVNSNQTIKQWYDAFIDSDREERLDDLIISPKIVNDLLNRKNRSGKIDLISSHLELINVDMELATMYGGYSDRAIRSSFLKLFSRLKKGIEDLKEEYDYILIDCPPNFNIVTQNAIIASDYYLVPTKADYLSTMGIDQLSRHVEKLEEKYNKYIDDNRDKSSTCEYNKVNVEMLGVVFTMLTIYDDEPVKASKSYIAQVERNGYDVFKNYTRMNNTKNAYAPESGIPLVLDLTLPEQYEMLRSELESICEEIEQKI